MLWLVESFYLWGCICSCRTWKVDLSWHVLDLVFCVICCFCTAVPPLACKDIVLSPSWNSSWASAEHSAIILLCFRDKVAHPFLWMPLVAPEFSRWEGRSSLCLNAGEEPEMVLVVLVPVRSYSCIVRLTVQQSRLLLQSCTILSSEVHCVVGRETCTGSSEF